MPQNSLKRIREQLLMSKTELARKTNVFPLTVDRIEKGMTCRLETKRKIIQALGMDLSEKNRIFPRIQNSYRITKRIRVNTIIGFTLMLNFR